MKRSMQYPDNLGLGHLAEQTFTREWYLLAVCSERKGNIPQAIAYCDLILAEGAGPDSPYYEEYIKAAHMKAEWEWLGFTR